MSSDAKNAQQRAVERLAMVLESCSGAEGDLGWINGEAPPEGWTEHARAHLRDLCLVAVDPVQVAAVRMTKEQCRGELADAGYENHTNTKYGIACESLCDSILAALEEP